MLRTDPVACFCFSFLKSINIFFWSSSRGLLLAAHLGKGMVIGYLVIVLGVILPLMLFYMFSFSYALETLENKLYPANGQSCAVLPCLVHSESRKETRQRKEQ